MRTIALIMAAGSSTRFGGDVPKIYTDLAGKTPLARSIEAFLTHPRIDGVRVMINREHHPLYRKHIMKNLTIYPCAIGGKTRQESVRRGLAAIKRVKPDYVLIHDAARPLVTHDVISRVLDGLEAYPAVLPAVPVVDTLRRGAEIIPRDELNAAQTPQGFHYSAIVDAHTRFATAQATDDIQLAEMAGYAIGVVEGDPLNFKLTLPSDFTMMEKMVSAATETRVGMGYDVHAFTAHDAGAPESQRALSLCGIKVPHPMKLLGHSDADVGLHALVDAMLGAISEGDIGQHFPPDDPKWAGADSTRFLLHAFELIAARSASIINIDVTIIGEKPKVSPHREAMQARIANLLKLDKNRVNIKATTTEKLGFLGRGEGLAAQAIVSLKVPA